MLGHRSSIQERLDRLVSIVPITGCWMWMGHINAKGYGKMNVRDDRGSHVATLAHRVSYSVHVGEIPSGMTLDHLCRNRWCVNPSHLDPVTSRENTLRGIGPSAMAAKATHCPKGHEYTPSNTYLPPGPSRRDCRTCIRARVAAYKQRTRP